MQIGIIGLGNFGTALAQHLACYHSSVLAWGRNQGLVDAINTKRENSSYLTGVSLHAGISATTDKQKLSSCSMLVFAVPSKILSTVISDITPAAHCLCVSAIKGIDASSGLTPIECLQNKFGRQVRYGVLSGPGFARDIVKGLPAGLVAASQEESAALEIATTFSHGNIRVYVSSDTIGVELGGIIKNVIAIAAGIVDGLGLGDSARAGIITRGLAEMMRLAVALGAQRETLSGLSGLGDLVLTATCDASRNRTVGLRLGQGETLTAIVESLNSVAEGITTTAQVLQLAEAHGIEMPITAHVHAVLDGGLSPAEMVTQLISRPLKKEF